METNQSPVSHNRFLSNTAIICYLAFARVLIHIATNMAGGYGYFRDEFYYIACSDHMAWGYVDQPPFSIAALWLSRLLVGDSLVALRLLPAIAGGMTVFLAGLIAKELGGKRFAQILAACMTLTAPQLLAAASFYSMNSFDVLFWSLAFYLIILIMKGDTRRYWILLGFVLGFGLLNKISVLWLGAGLALGLLFTPGRKMFLAPGVWITAAIACLLFLPHILWQVKYGFPTLEFIKNATGNKYIAIFPWEMFANQVLDMNPFSFPFWFAGLLFFLVGNPSRRFRILPLIYLAVFTILAINRNSKSEYLGPMSPMLFALGACATEALVLRLNWNWLKPATVALLVFTGIVAAPFAIAVLPVETFIAYQRALGKTPSTPERKQLAQLPQFYADRFGWKEMVAELAKVYNTLTDQEKATCTIVLNNYGEAAALDFFGTEYHLPRAVCGHNNYWIWGPRGASGEVVIRMSGSKQAMLESYREVTEVGVFKNTYCMPYENNQPIYLCRHRLARLSGDWEEFKHYE